MLNATQKSEVEQLVESSLDTAESTWDAFGEKLVCLANERSILNRKAANESIETQIPGYDKINELVPQLDDFIAIVADMRDSTKHLIQAIAAPAKVSQLQRIYYETAALIPALSKSIIYENGKVTEYLGDGVLGLILASDDKRPAAIYASHRAAENCLNVVSDIVNPILARRYKLPALKIGVGLSYSRAIVTVVGTDEHREGKVFGQCVYHATKLSSGENQIYVDEAMKYIWPTEKGGTIRFRPVKVKDIDGYLLTDAS
ncbi:MAG: hypothetical protein WC661_01350 [Opitutaceae bacterium]|jgi:hypothetical protein